jgi:hypothetical protein
MREAPNPTTLNGRLLWNRRTQFPVWAFRILYAGGFHSVVTLRAEECLRAARRNRDFLRTFSPKFGTLAIRRLFHNRVTQFVEDSIARVGSRPALRQIPYEGSSRSEPKISLRHVYYLFSNYKRSRGRGRGHIANMNDSLRTHDRKVVQ